MNEKEKEELQKLFDVTDKLVAWIENKKEKLCANSPSIAHIDRLIGMYQKIKEASSSNHPTD